VVRSGTLGWYQPFIITLITQNSVITVNTNTSTHMTMAINNQYELLLKKDSI